MIFDDDNEVIKRASMNTFSKSFGDMYKQCPLKAWFQLRDKRQDSSKLLEIGKYTHELFAQKISVEYKKEPYQIKKEGIDPVVKFESKLMMQRINLDNIIEKDDVVLAVEEFHKHFLKNGIELVGIFDLVLLKQSTKGAYIQVFDLKTGHKVSKEVDLQCMIYTLLANKIYPGLPINFVVYSAKTGDTWGKFFSPSEAEALEEIIEEYSSEVQKSVESEYKPIPKCSAKCVNCSFFKDCTAAQDFDDNDVDSLMNAMIYSKTRASQCEKKLKELREEQKDDKAIIASNGYSVDFKEYVIQRISTKKTTKADLINLIANSKGGLNEVISDVDIKLTDRVINIGKELGLEFKSSITRKIAITVSEEDKEDTEEAKNDE